MSKSIARVGDSTSHGGLIVTGSTNVFVNGRPAATTASNHVCPMVTPPPVKPHVGGKAAMKRGTVFINGKPAVCAGDKFTCTGKTPAEPAATVLIGSPNVFIG
jgi:uncharacterized Zn-binding protein involved in type VI secretion